MITVAAGKRSLSVGLLLSALLAGCSPAPEQNTVDSPRDGALDVQIETLDKARSVEQQLKDSADMQRRTIEDQGG